MEAPRDLMYIAQIGVMRLAANELERMIKNNNMKVLVIAIILRNHLPKMTFSLLRKAICS